MLRTALTPRYLGLLALALVVAAAFVQLGRWQLGVAENTGQLTALEQARDTAPAPLQQVLAPHAAFPGALSTRPVTAVGHYAEGQLLVPHRRLDGRQGSWVVTPFVVDASHAVLPVLRGFLPDGSRADQPPQGTLTVAGGLAPPESPTGVATGPGEIGSVDTSVLVNIWSGDLYNAFLFLGSEEPSAPSALASIPVPVGSTGITWRNAAYAVQWWVFALFVLWLWWRMVREEARRADTPAPEHGSEAVGDGPGERSPSRAEDTGAREHI